MAAGNAVWGIDIGQCALKAIKLRPADDGKVEAVAFDVVEHEKILSQPDADRDELIRAALKKFAERNDWQGDKFIVGVPGQQTFARFCKMPPIDLKKDAKKIPELVRYEASQQIPFDMDDVVWDYQVFTDDDSPDVEVGIFAIRKDLIRKHLGFFAEVGIAPTGVQTVPAALYNFCQFDGQAGGENTATVIIDVGAQNTDLIIVEPHSAWTRNIPLGGNSFTETLVRAFKLSFAKAENLKRGAANSKYARQIFQAMRPIFADLVAEIQRSIGFYSSTRRDVELTRVLALGNAFHLPGLQKYLENNLTVAGGVVKIEKFTKLLPTQNIAQAQFADNILSFPAAYGLALQGLGLGEIRATLLPPELARVAVWRKKQPYFIATAASLLVAAAVPIGANTMDRNALSSATAEQAQRDTESIIREAKNYQNQYNQAHQDTGQRENDIKQLRELQNQKRLLPRVLTLVNDALPEVRQPQLAAAQSPAELRELIKSDPERFKRTERGQILLESFNVEYVPDVTKVSFGDASSSSDAPPGMDPGGFGAPGGGRGRMMPGGGRGRMMPGGGRGRMMPGGPMGGAPPAPSDGAAKPENAGFVVRVSGRLLYGERQSVAFAFVEDYLQRMRELSQSAGAGFYIPFEEKPEDRPWNIEPLTPFHQTDSPSAGMSRGGMRNTGGRGRMGPSAGRGRAAPTAPPTGAPGAGAEDSGVKYPDPVTGEETATDWRLELEFKLHLGDPPERAEEGGESAQDPGSENR